LSLVYNLKTYNGILNFLKGIMISLVGDRLSYLSVGGTLMSYMLVNRLFELRF